MKGLAQTSDLIAELTTPDRSAAEVDEIAHKIKGAASSIGLADTTEAMVRIQRDIAEGRFAAPDRDTLTAQLDRQGKDMNAFLEDIGRMRQVGGSG